MKKVTYIIIFFFSFISNVKGQEIPFCGSDKYENILQQDIEYRLQQDNFEEKYRRPINRDQIKFRDDQIIIPLVFHIIHNNGPENISDARIIQGLEYLNQAFTNIGPFYNEKGVNTHIQFCLAQRDEQGNAFSGITKHQSIYTDMSIFEGYEYIKSIQFDPEQYLNIQVVKNACLGTDCDVAGFGGQNRIVVEAQYIGNSITNTALLIHEMGHALGLDHTFKGGCKNDDCLTDGDKVCDTPPDNRTFEHCFFTENSCPSDEDDTSDNNPYRPVSMGGLGNQDDDHSNYMDYNFWECYDHFTQGQADRMYFFIMERYASILESKVCLPPCTAPVTALFELHDSIELGSTIDIINLSTNTDTYQWFVNNNPISNDKNLSYSFMDLGLIEVSLFAFASDSLCEDDHYVQSIRIFCPVSSCIDYKINGQYLAFEDCSEKNLARTWSVLRGNGDTLYTSTNSTDSFYINNIDFVRLCLEATGEYCSDWCCEYVTIASDGSEICDNEVDDDGDGLIDLFDSDCPCGEMAYQAQCLPECEIILDSFKDIKMRMKWESTQLNEHFIAGQSKCVIGDINYDGFTEILSNYGRGGINNSMNYISVLSGQSGDLIDSIQIFPEYNSFEVPVSPTIVRTVINNNIYIYIYERGQIVCLNIYGNEIFRSSHPSIGFGVSPALADFNADGIPEVYCGDVVFSGLTGAILFIGRDRDCIQNGSCRLFQPVAADVIGNDNIPELITGKHVYQLSITNLNDTLGNFATIIEAPNGIEDGRCAVSDINGDGLLDVIVVERNYSPQIITGSLAIWDPRTRTSYTKVSNPSIDDFDFGGGMPFVGDVDGDCTPEIGVVYERLLRMFKYTSTTGLQILYDIPTSDESGFTGVTMFDFNQDGKQELVYRDETSLRIFEGETGATIDSFPLFSGTGSEYPIVADVDNDGEAEIIVSGSRTSRDEVRLYCFESASTPWAPARSVWNQYAYNPTQVNDDLTIPRYQQNAAQPLQGTENCPRETCNTPYNNFMVQTTYRTQEGCYVWPELQQDLSISATSRCLGDSIEICFIVSATDSTFINNGVMVSCYAPPWSNGVDEAMDTLRVSQDTTCIMIPKIPEVDSIMIVINDEGGYYPPDFPNSDIIECDYTNNEFVLNLEGPDFSIDILDYKCSPDSLIFYIATDNVGKETDVSCIEGGCYFISPLDDSTNPQQNLLEITTWCFDYDSISMVYQYKDTFKVAIPIPIGETAMWWTINEGGFGPGLESSDITSIYECDYTNNTDSIHFDIEEKILDLGSDITKCETEVFTLNAGSGFATYLWNDYTTDSIYSSSYSGLHYIEAIDRCNRVYNDTIEVVFDNVAYVDLGGDISLCMLQDTVLEANGNFDKINWYPADAVDCDTCKNVTVSTITSIQIIAKVSIDNCISFDTINIFQFIPEIDSTFQKYCIGDTIDFFGQLIFSSGEYEYLTPDCQTLHILDAKFIVADTGIANKTICEGDSILFNGQYYTNQGIYEYQIQNQFGCDSLTVLDLKVEGEINMVDSLTICDGDSVLIFGEWIYEDSFLQESYITSYGCDSVQTTIVNVVKYPPAPTAEVDCENLNIIASIDASSEWKILWDNGDTLTQTIYENQGEVYLNLFAEPNCEKQFVLTLPNLPAITEIPEISDTTLSKNQSISMDLGVDLSEWSINWSPSNLVDCDTCTKVILSPTFDTEVSVSLTHISGCEYELNFNIKIEENSDIYIPNIFTPDGDNINDEWKVFASENIEILSCSIFDRWGEQVYKSENKSINWDGYFRGKESMSGVYVYAIKYQDKKGELNVITGDVTLIR